VQVLEGRRVGPVTVLKYRRQLKKAEEKDKDIDVEKVIIDYHKKKVCVSAAVKSTI